MPSKKTTSQHSVGQTFLSAMRAQHAYLLFTLLFFIGCQSTPVPTSILPQLAANDDQTQLDFWHTLATKNLVSNDEALHGLLLFLHNQDNATNYSDRVATLKRANILPSNFNQPENTVITRGTLATALVNALNLKSSSVNLLLLGSNPHHATRQLEYENIYPPSSPNQILTGSDYVGIIGACRDYSHGNPADYPASVMPSQISSPHPQLAAVFPPVGATLVSPSSPDPVAPIFANMLVDQLTLQPTTTTTTTSPSTRATITSVEGLANYRENETSPWKKAATGIELSESAELRTGPNGAIQLRIEPDQTIAIDRLTTVKLLKIFQQGNKAATDIGIKYGRTRYDLEGGGLEHQSTLRSPNATLAVRGTRVSLFDQPPFTPQAVSLTGRAQFAGYRKQPTAFGAAGQGKTVITTENNNPAELALRASTIDPVLQGARTQSEVPLVENLISRGATILLDRTSGLRIVRGGTVPRTDAELRPLLPGQLSFVLRWTGNTNLDFAVSTPNTTATRGGEFVYPVAGLAVASSGGRTAFDHQGGKNGGIEVVFFNKNITPGIYSLAGPNVGTQPAVATIDAFYNGQRINLFDGLTLSPTITQTVAPGQPALALASVGSDFPFTPPRAPQRVRPLAKTFISFENPPKAVMVGPKPTAVAKPHR